MSFVNMQNGGIDIELKRRRTVAMTRKSPVIPETVNDVVEYSRYILSVAILSAENVDESAGVFNCVRGLYQVCATASHHPKEEYFRTNAVRGDEVFPKWNTTMHVAFKERPVSEYLVLEVVQHVKNYGDPRTSNGTVVLGRAKIPVPEVLGVQGKRRIELVSMCPWGKTIGGFLWLNMKLHAEPL